MSGLQCSGSYYYNTCSIHFHSKSFSSFQNDSQSTFVLANFGLTISTYVLYSKSYKAEFYGKMYSFAGALYTIKPFDNTVF